MSWYKEWFSSENYLIVYKHRDESEAERLVELIVNNFNFKNETSVLDMACGAGRHAIEFAKRGFNVTAVDLSQTLLVEAEQNAAKTRVEIDFVHSDIRDFKIERKFDLVVNLFTSIGYFETDQENLDVIKKGYNFLGSGGYFVLDYFNKNYLIKNLVPKSLFSENGTKIIQTRSIKGDRVIKKITIEKDSGNEQFYESVRLYSYEEVVKMVESTGFRILEKFGDYNGQSYNKELSSRLIIFASK
jgi:SAM-dependent methyltransferase